MLDFWRFQLIQSIQSITTNNMKTVIVYQTTLDQNRVEVFTSLKDAMVFARNNISELVETQLEFILRPWGPFDGSKMKGAMHGYDKEREAHFSFITRDID